MRKKKRGGRGEREGRGSLRGKGEKGKKEGKGEGRENLGGQAPQMFFPRTAPG